MKGDRKGTYDLFADNLPGTPDNIRPAHDGGYWVALPSIRKWPISLLDLVGPYPGVKNVLAKVIHLTISHLTFEIIRVVLKIRYFIGTLRFGDRKVFEMKEGACICVAKEGKI